jgi:hypothetical protein
VVAEQLRDMFSFWSACADGHGSYASVSTKMVAGVAGLQPKIVDNAIGSSFGAHGGCFGGGDMRRGVIPVITLSVELETDVEVKWRSRDRMEGLGLFQMGDESDTSESLEIVRR